MGNFLSSIFVSSEKAEQTSSKNIHNMALLVAVNSPLSDPGAHDLVVEDSALVPELGPMGTAAEATIHKPTSDQISVYVVREGDTLSQIAEMFNVNVNTIKWGNDLSSNTLKVGETLIILPISGVRHKVVKGDTVASLAKKYKGDVEEILAYNNLALGDALSPGSEVIIPDGEVIQTPSAGSSIKVNTSGLKEQKGFYMRPIVGGKRSQGLHGYNAVDIAAPVGTPILAAADGEVIISRSGGWNGGYGNYVVIRHSNGTQTLYSHNSKNLVSVGDTVKQGDTIGLVGISGKVTGAHLHFEIRGAKNPF